MTTTTCSAHVSAPIAKVWGVLTDHEAMAQWAPGMRVTMDKQGSVEPNGLGAVRRIAAPGPAPAIVEEVVLFESPSVFGYQALSGVPFKNYSGEVRLSEVAGGTQIDWSLSFTPRVPHVERVAVAGVNKALLASLVRAINRT